MSSAAGIWTTIDLNTHIFNVIESYHYSVVFNKLISISIWFKCIYTAKRRSRTVEIEGRSSPDAPIWFHRYLVHGCNVCKYLYCPSLFSFFLGYFWRGWLLFDHLFHSFLTLFSRFTLQLFSLSYSLAPLSTITKNENLNWFKFWFSAAKYRKVRFPSTKTRDRDTHPILGREYCGGWFPGLAGGRTIPR